MDKYFMYKCMESSNSSCNVSRIIASMSGRVDETPHRNDETPHRNDETAKRQTKTNRCGQ